MCRVFPSCVNEDVPAAPDPPTTHPHPPLPPSSHCVVFFFFFFAFFAWGLCSCGAFNEARGRPRPPLVPIRIIIKRSRRSPALAASARRISMRSPSVSVSCSQRLLVRLFLLRRHSPARLALCLGEREPARCHGNITRRRHFSGGYFSFLLLLRLSLRLFFPLPSTCRRVPSLLFFLSSLTSNNPTRTPSGKLRGP